ncbi:TIGR03087 family PEP-CTERM/XrtA system glycosyltransferase [Altererythrobacter soli]|uniref:TIGR03087 family PEP-CTERM/XrtA system glycosyltransferase n=1 Tax=Croceibacterium soli TaxID=1739690 RepID=A0A6I4UU09_9SPHN|nr:TIGR03087 family PEP-CTERM/XrtA system glycosyltransferase [Croceibacterium soli]MXP42400.1 TIGR03087 family PEP-CTERM/XrtA system glycosyltransferase [Croceibacterium soli]
MSGEILFLAHRMPFPPDRGDKIRSHHILKALADLAPVHVACFAESGADRAHEAELAAVAASHCLADRTKPLMLAGIESLLRREPVSLSAFRHAGLAGYVERLLRERPIDTIYVFSGQMGQYVPQGWSGRLVVDLVDVDSAKFEAYAAEKAWPTRWVDAREGRLLRAEESRLAGIADRTLLVSEAEAALFRSRVDASHAAKVVALGNGVDFSAFDPAQTAPHPQLAAAPGPHLVFTGQMDYPPNVAAARRVARSILPAVRRHHPQAQFHIVGRAPAAELRALDGQGGVRVWGEVPAVQPFLRAADLVVAPLAIARGVQNKVLEAMAMARPVLLSPDAAAGIGATDGEHLAVEDDDAAFARRALELLSRPEQGSAMGAAARRFVVERMSWPAMLAPLPALVGRGAERPGHRDAA